MANLIRIFALALSIFSTTHAYGGEADVIKVDVRKAGNNRYNFDVTIRSKDTGWERYADRFEVLTLQGQILGTRTLLHPHEDEQPFTRELYGVQVPSDITQVVIRAHFKPKGYDGVSMTVTLPKS